LNSTAGAGRPGGGKQKCWKNLEGSRRPRNALRGIQISRAWIFERTRLPGKASAIFIYSA